MSFSCNSDLKNIQSTKVSLSKILTNFRDPVLTSDQVKTITLHSAFPFFSFLPWAQQPLKNNSSVLMRPKPSQVL